MPSCTAVTVKLDGSFHVTAVQDGMGAGPAGAPMGPPPSGTGSGAGSGAVFG